MISGPASSERSVDLSRQIRHPNLLRLYECWSERKDVRRLPSRRDIDPLDFPYILGNVMLVDVLRNPQPLAVQHNRILGGHSRRCEALWLPLSDIGEDITLLLCALLYQGNRS